MTRSRRILVVDDEMLVRESLAEVLRSEGHTVITAHDGRSALTTLNSTAIDVVITDLRMAEGDGHFLLEESRREGLEIPVIMMTGAGTIADAVRAMKAGAFDFVTKPVEPDQLLRLIGHALERTSLRRELMATKRSVADLRGDRCMVGDSAAMRAIRQQIEQVAATDATVLVTGESGTGKELVAEAIHQASPRAGQSLVRVNCAAIPDGLFESEFFGHRRGSFSGAVGDRVGRFEEARGGTLQLDEIGTLKAEGQAKLLRVLEGGEYQAVGESRTQVADSRVIAVTNDELRARVTEGSFRADLYYRLNVFPIQVPPLRERRDDIPALTAALIGRLRGGVTKSKGAQELDARALAVLEAYHWPGNVRELRNVIERAMILTTSPMPDADLFARLIESSLDGAVGPALVESLHLRTNLDRLERDLVEQALVQSGRKKKRAAELLGVDPRNLGYYLRKHGIESGP